MSITGHLLSLRKKRPASNLFSEQASPRSFAASFLERTDAASELSIRTHISALSGLKKNRHHSHLLSDEANLAKGKYRRETGADDTGSPPRAPASIHTPARPNDIKRVNGASESNIADRPGIVVIHPRAFFRDCFVRCLEVSYRSHNIIAFANIYAWKASQAGTALNPSIIVFFVDGADVSSVSELQFLETAATDTPVVIVSDIDDVNYVVRALKGGARGYIPTSLSFNVAVEAVRLVEAGGTFVPVSSLAMDRGRETSAKTGDILTERQMMVVEALCQGMANKQIAYELGMSEHTVKVHLRHIMRKLRARNRTEVAVLTKDFFERPHDQKRPDTEDGHH